MERKKNILIVGNSVSAIALAKKLKSYEETGEIFATGMACGMPDYVKMVDIREEKVEEMLSFVLQNDINLTVVLSKKAIKADIAGFFSANGQMIFSPDTESAKQIIDEALTKKFLYKLRIPTSKFGVFEKPQLAADYLKTANFPLVIKTSEPETERDLFACPTVSVANIAINDLFFKSEPKIVIEEFISGHNFTYYIVTDGYKALPLGTVTSYKFSDEVNGGYLTKGSGASMPDFKVTQEMESRLMRDVVARVLNSLENNGNPYLGILGFNCVLKEDKIFVESIAPFVEDAHAQMLYNSLDENLLALFEACAMGVFADDYEEIKTNNLASVSVTLFSRYDGKEIQGVENLDEPENLNLCGFKTRKGAVGTLTASASTLTRAKEKLAGEVQNIKFEGLKYRKDLIY
ncbi:MAG: hypothetical protein NC390_03790 [Fusobacterium sp.]|nr:hypothetical protein [Fusobacterium sp.]